jgi:8-oxo-dGTP diphosphatase
MRKPEHEFTRIGACAVIKHEGKYLLGFRIGKHAPNVWAFPGGHVEWGEHPFDTVVRETKEETNLDIELAEDWDAGWNSHVYESEGSHYITLLVKCNVLNPEALKVMEPTKFREWKWFAPDEIPTELMPSLIGLGIFV